MPDSFTQRVVNVIKRIPKGRVATYGQIATMAGSPRGARQVVRILHTLTEKERLPWHRVINREGRVSLPPGGGYEMQKAMLEDEGVVFGLRDTVDMKRFQWSPRNS